METSVELQKSVVNVFDELTEKGTCLDTHCSTPVSELIGGQRVGINFLKCPNCGSLYTKNSYKGNVPDPDRNRLKTNWVV